MAIIFLSNSVKCSKNRPNSWVRVNGKAAVTFTENLSVLNQAFSYQQMPIEWF